MHNNIKYLTEREKNKASETHSRKTIDQVLALGTIVSGLGHHCTTRQFSQQNGTINGFLWYLVTEEVVEQNIGYRRIAE